MILLPWFFAPKNISMQQHPKYIQSTQNLDCTPMLFREYYNIIIIAVTKTIVIPWYLDLYIVLHGWHGWSILCYMNTKRKGKRKKNCIMILFVCPLFLCFEYLKKRINLHKLSCVKEQYDKNWYSQHKHYSSIFIPFHPDVELSPGVCRDIRDFSSRLAQTTFRFWHLFSSPMNY